MKKTRIAILATALMALVVTAALAAGPGFGPGAGAGPANCPLYGANANPEQAQKFAKFQQEVLPLKQKMMQLKTELVTLRAQTAPDAAAVAAKQKEIIDLRSDIQKRAVDSGVTGCGGGMGRGRGMGMHKGMGMRGGMGCF